MLLRLSDRLLAQRCVLHKGCLADVSTHYVALAYPWELFALLIECASTKHGALSQAGENLHAVLLATRDRQSPDSNVVCMRTAVWLHTRLLVAALSRVTLAMNQSKRQKDAELAEALDRCVNDIGCVLAQLATGCDQHTQRFDFVSELFDSMGFTLQCEMDTDREGKRSSA